MKFATIFALVSILIITDAYAPIGHPQSPNNNNLPMYLKKSAMSALTVISLATNIATATPPASAWDSPTAIQLEQYESGIGSIGVRSRSSSMDSSSSFVSAKVIKEGLYREYEVDVPETQQLDSAESTFKSAKETKSKKGKYTALLAILVVGSFVIPMAQYFWYVRDDDSTDRFFQGKLSTPAPKEPPKKKGWF